MPSTPTLWLEDHGNSLVELDGYHLEQAALYKAELGSPVALEEPVRRPRRREVPVSRLV